jgi:hypothetical protein
MASYTLHHERTDGTLDDAFISYPSKRAALRVAGQLAKSSSFDVVRLIVNDAEQMTIKVYTLPAWKP